MKKYPYNSGRIDIFGDEIWLFTPEAENDPDYSVTYANMEEFYKANPEKRHQKINRNMNKDTGGEIATATEIRNQIGSKALYMLGAYDIFSDKGALGFKIRGSRKWRHIKIRLNGKDLYDITFTNWRKKDMEDMVTETIKDVHVENLHSVIEKETGLYTNLASGGSITHKEINEQHTRKESLEEKYRIIRKWADNMISDEDIDDLLDAMVASGISDSDLHTKPTKTGTQYTNAKDVKTDEIWKKIQKKYSGSLKGNQPLTPIRTMVDAASRFNDNLIERYKKERKNMFTGGKTEDDYTKNLGMVEVIFINPDYNYSTNVSGDTTEEQAREYFVGKYLNVAPYPNEKMARVIDIKFHPKGTYASGGTIRKVRVDIPSKGQQYATVQEERDGKIITDMGEFRKEDIIHDITVDKTKFMAQGGKTIGKNWKERYGEHFSKVKELFNEHYKGRPRFKTIEEARRAGNRWGNWIIFVDSPDGEHFYTMTTFDQKWVNPGDVYGMWNELTLIEKSKSKKSMEQGGKIEVQWNSVTKDTWHKFEDWMTGKGIIFQVGPNSQTIFNRFLKETGHVPCIRSEGIKMADGGLVNGLDVDEILKHFLVAGLWASYDDNEENLDVNYSISDVDENSKKEIVKGIRKFIHDNAGIIKRLGLSEESIGHDLFLDSQGHGVGFWDRNYIPKQDGKILSESASKIFPSDQPYVGDDGKVYFNTRSTYAEGGRIHPHFRKGSIVIVHPENDNEGYDNFRGKPLRITHVATSEKDHPGFDTGVGQALYDLEDVKTGKPIGSSLYDYELDAYNKKDIGGILIAGTIGTAIGAGLGYGYRDSITKSKEEAIAANKKRIDAAKVRVEEQKKRFREKKEKIKRGLIGSIERLEHGGQVNQKDGLIGKRVNFTHIVENDDRGLFDKKWMNEDASGTIVDKGKLNNSTVYVIEEDGTGYLFVLTFDHFGEALGVDKDIISTTGVAERYESEDWSEGKKDIEEELDGEGNESSDESETELQEEEPRGSMETGGRTKNPKEYAFRVIGGDEYDGYYSYEEAEEGRQRVLDSSGYPEDDVTEPYVKDEYSSGGSMEGGGKVYIDMQRRKYVLIDTRTKQRWANEYFTDIEEARRFAKDNKITIVEKPEDSGKSGSSMAIGGRASASKEKLQNDINKLEKSIVNDLTSDENREKMKIAVKKKKSEIAEIDAEEKRKEKEAEEEREKQQEREKVQKLLKKKSPNKSLYIDMDKSLKKKMRNALAHAGIPYESQTSGNTFRVYLSNQFQLDKAIALYNERREKAGLEPVDKEEVSKVIKKRVAGKKIAPAIRKRGAKEKLSQKVEKKRSNAKDKLESEE